MTSDFDIRPMVERNSALPMNRLKVLRSFEKLRLSEIRRGIVFVFAAWSGPSVSAFQLFTKVINSMDTGTIELVVLDTDCLTQESATHLFGAAGFTTGGWGEVIWIREGQVIAREIAHSKSEMLIEQHTRSLQEPIS